jgi:hypothetical protein
MLVEADKYAAVFPRLEWMYIGQLQLGISTVERTPGKGSKRRAVPLAHNRQVCSRERNEIFGDEDYW